MLVEVVVKLIALIYSMKFVESYKVISQVDNQKYQHTY